MTKVLGFVYLGSIVEGFTLFCGLLGFVLLVIGAILIVCGLTGKKELSKEAIDNCFKYGRRCLYVCAIPMLFAIFLPTKQFCYIAAGVESAEYIANETKIGRALNDNTAQIIKDVSTIIHNYANEKKDPDTEQKAE